MVDGVTEVSRDMTDDLGEPVHMEVRAIDAEHSGHLRGATAVRVMVKQQFPHTCADFMLSRTGAEALRDILTEALGDRSTLEEDMLKIRAALQRLGSMEAFHLSRPIKPDDDAELLARIEFARLAVEG